MERRCGTGCGAEMKGEDCLHRPPHASKYYPASFLVHASYEVQGTFLKKKNIREEILSGLVPFFLLEISLLPSLNSLE